MQANELIASIEFAAGDSDGTDGATIAAGIHAIAEDDFSGTVNTTKLVFTTGASETAAFGATAKMTLSSAGLLTIADDFMIKDGGTIGVASTNDAITIASTGIVTFKDDILIKDGGTIGVASTAGAITIASDGDTTFNADVNVGANFDVTGNAVIDGTALVTGVLTATAGSIFNGGLTTTGALLGGVAKILFRDSGLFINSSTDGQLDIDADTELELTAPTIQLVASTKVDIDGAVDMSSTLAVGGIADFADHVDLLDNKELRLGTGNDYKFDYNGSRLNIIGTGDTVVDITGDFYIDAAGSEIFFQNGGTNNGRILMANNVFSIGSTENNGDVKIIGIDGGADLTACTFDMSEAGLATFNSGITVGGGVDDSVLMLTSASGGNASLKFDPSANDFAISSNSSSANINFKTSSTTRMRLGVGGDFTTFPLAGQTAVFNDDAVNVDFIVKSDDNSNMLFVDGGDNKVAIGHNAPIARLDVMSQGISASNLSMVIGADEGNTANPTRTNDTDKANRIGMPHYANGEEPAAMFVCSSTNGVNNIGIGGGTSVMNAATQIVFITAANATTTSGTSRGRFDSAGSFLVGKDSSSETSAGFQVTGGNVVTVGSSSGFTYQVNDGSAFKWRVNANGGVYNFQSNNVNLSDQREKKNIEALDAQWDAVKAWSVKEFHYNEDENSDAKKVGVIAQDVETNHPNLVTDFELSEDKTRKAVKEQQLMWLAIKALQEAQARIETLETKVAALEG